jgi:hypothetical protein
VGGGVFFLEGKTVKFLIDTQSETLRQKMALSDLVRGQLITPLTGYADAGTEYAIDNGAFSGFDQARFSRLLQRQAGAAARCIFVACPDVVANGRRTLELWHRRQLFTADCPQWYSRLAFVAQDGIEDLEIPWDEFEWLFVGGGDPWKDSRASMDIVRTAKALRKRIHVGRVNEINRYRRFAELGADTCDGSGIARYDHMLDTLLRKLQGPEERTLFDE